MLIVAAWVYRVRALNIQIILVLVYIYDSPNGCPTSGPLTTSVCPPIRRQWKQWPCPQCLRPRFKYLQVVLCFFSLPACSYVCATVPSGSKGTSSGSLMLSVMKLASCVAQDNSSVQKLAFALLTNLAISRDCRGVFQKVFKKIEKTPNSSLLFLFLF